MVNLSLSIMVGLYKPEKLKVSYSASEKLQHESSWMSRNLSNGSPCRRLQCHIPKLHPVAMLDVHVLSHGTQDPHVRNQGQIYDSKRARTLQFVGFL